MRILQSNGCAKCQARQRSMLLLVADILLALAASSSHFKSYGAVHANGYAATLAEVFECIARCMHNVAHSKSRKRTLQMRGDPTY